MLPMGARSRALLCLLLALQLTAAHDARLVRRQDGGDSPAPTTTSIESESEPEPTGRTNTEDAVSSTSGADGDESESTTLITTTLETTAIGRTMSSTASLAVSTDGALDDSTFLNVTIPDGQLPITPALTPGWGVAGAILLITGLVYTLIGFKNRSIHTFFSTAFVVGLGTSVLIVYLMKVPVTDGAQGGYVTAAVVAGCLAGAVSVWFRELTDCLGCALGGFCVSMWLLCLVPGGLLKTVATKAIFISCLTMGALAFYFSRHTRDWALITMISFAGATSVVLGIDCYSRAGLKEFWVYVWELNDDLFPLGVDTYPVTKGIRVETAAIVIVFLAGIVSQIKLWRIVREKRDKRALEREEGRRNLEQEEVDVGRQVEEATARERREWERIYGDGEIGAAGAAAASSSSDTGSEKRLRQSFNPSTKPHSVVEHYEMTDMSSDTDRDRQPPAKADPMERDEEGRVTVRVAADDTPPPPQVMHGEMDDDISEKRDSTLGATLRSSAISADRNRQSSALSVPGAPEVVPLPFTVPIAHDNDAQSDADRSSIATFAADDDDDHVHHRYQERTYAPRRSRSFAKRLSQGSSKMLRSLSQRSARASARHSANLEAGESSEDLVVPHVQQDDESSIAATFDGQSDFGSEREPVLGTEQHPGKEPPLDAADGEARKLDTEIDQKELDSNKKQPSTVSEGQNTDKALNTEQTRAEEPVEAPVDDVKESHDGRSKSKSMVSATSTRASLTRDRLPESLSKVALSYRTNEWAKHLSYADSPEPDELAIEPRPVDPATRHNSTRERPAPVDVEGLQQAAHQGALAPAIARSDSRLSNPGLQIEVSRTRSRLSMASETSSPDGEQTFSPPPTQAMHPMLTAGANPNMARSPSLGAARRTSATFEPIAEEYAGDGTHQMHSSGSVRPMSTSPALPTAPAQGVRQSASSSGLVPYSNSQTLMSRRESFLRSRSSGNLLRDLPEEGSHSTLRPDSSASSLYNYPVYAAALSLSPPGGGVDPDDMPLSQRRDIIRHNSLVSLQGRNSALQRSSSGMDLGASADRQSMNNTTFDSHQPKRNSSLPTSAVREAQLANFRSSVAQDLQAGSPMLNVAPSRATPFASTTNVLTGTGGRETEIRQAIDQQRDRIMGLKEAEAQRRETDRQQKEWNDRAFEERMRSGELMDLHREAMKRMEKAVHHKSVEQSVQQGAVQSGKGQKGAKRK